MATAQKVFVSPGVYTTETDLSFVAQSVGVTTLGIVGETILGPAFEPIFITSFDEFQALFGPTSPEKFVNTQIPKYEAAYIAKSYLQQSNQLFVTRILGLSGYDAGPSWSITTVANVDTSTIAQSGSSADFNFTFSGNSTTINLVQGSMPDIIWDNLDTPYTQNDGTVSSLRSDIEDMISGIANSSGSTSGSSLYVWGAVDGTDLTDLTGATYNDVTNAFDVSDMNLDTIVFSASTSENDEWYYATFNKENGDLTSPNYTGYSFLNYCTTITGGTSGSYSSFSGVMSGSVYYFDGTSYSEYDNLVVATLRSRGISLYNSTTSGPRYQVTGLTDVVINTAGAYSGISTNPFSTFAVSGITYEGETFTFETSFQSADSEYITKVFSIANFAKSRLEVPLFVEEYYQTMMNWAYNNGYLRGLNPELTALPEARGGDVTSIANNLFQYQSPRTPWVVSELRGNKVYNLFRFVSISDGDLANTQVKISMMNMSFNNSTFDIMVRDFFDTDANPVVLEKYTNCTMDPGSNSFVGKKIGSSDGEYPLNSKYIMVELSEEYPVDALPCGFEGYIMRDYTGDNQSPIDRKSTRLNSSHVSEFRMPSSA